VSEVQFDDKMRVELIKCNASDVDVARAAWVSNYGEDAREKDAGRIEGLINFLYREKHMSPFEHGSFTFFVDVPIFVAREFMRHRTFSYNEVSGRYTTLKPKFYLPSIERPVVQQGKIGNYYFTAGTDEQYAQMVARKKQTIELEWQNYLEQLDLGIAREVARDELGVGIYTQFYATVNPRNLMQFLTLRTASNALYEIRDTAEQMENFLELQMPLTWAVFNKEREDNSVDYRKAYYDLLKRYSDLRADYDDLSRTINEGGE
jgi:thymidylate synthase (FAD)